VEDVEVVIAVVGEEGGYERVGNGFKNAVGGSESEHTPE
jgi:hypothetical protein